MKKLIYVAFILVVACGKNNSKNEAAAPSPIPNTLSFSKPTSGTPLSPEQAKEIASVFSKKEMMILPPGELIFPPQKDSYFNPANEEAKLKVNHPQTYEMLKEIQSGCVKNRPTVNLDMQVPGNGDTSFENLKMGDRFSMSNFSGALSGDACPVDATANSGLSVKVEQIDQASKSGTFSLSGSLKGKGVSLNPKYSNLLQKRGLIVDSTLSGLVTKLDNEGKALINYELSGSYLSLSFDIPYSMKVQGLNHTDGKGNYSTEIIMTTVLKMPNYSVEIVNHSVSGTGTPTTETYVNGHLMSPSDFNQLFGRGNPAGSPSSQTVLTTLK